LRQYSRSTDKITSQVLDLVDQKLLVDRTRRGNTEDVCRDLRLISQSTVEFTPSIPDSIVKFLRDFNDQSPSQIASFSPPTQWEQETSRQEVAENLPAWLFRSPLSTPSRETKPTHISDSLKRPEDHHPSKQASPGHIDSLLSRETSSRSLNADTQRMSETPNISPLQESVNKIAANAQDIAAQPISSLQLTTAQTVIAGVAAGGAVACGTGTLTGAISTAAHNKEMQRQGRVKLEIDKLKLDLDIRAESSRESANWSVVAEDGEEMHGRKNKWNQQHHRDSDDNAKLSSAPQRDGDRSTRGDLGRESSLGRPSSATPSGSSFQKRAPIPKASSSTIFKKSRPGRTTHLEKVRRNIANFKQSLKTRTHDDALDQKLSGTLSTLRHELDHGQPSNMAALVAHTEPAQVAKIVHEDDAVRDGSAPEEEDDAASDEEDYDSGGGADDLAMRVILPSATIKD